MKRHMMLTRTALTAATVLALIFGAAGAASAASAEPTRDGGGPLTQYGGCTDFVTADYGDNGWQCDGPGVKNSITAGDGTWIEARYPGWCIDPGSSVKKVARPFHHVTCGK